MVKIYIDTISNLKMNEQIKKYSSLLGVIPKLMVKEQQLYTMNRQTCQVHEAIQHIWHQRQADKVLDVCVDVMRPWCKQSFYILDGKSNLNNTTPIDKY